MSIENATPKKRGRPATGKQPHVSLRMAPEMIAALDTWAAEQADKPGRSECIRRIIAEWMDGNSAKG